MLQDFTRFCPVFSSLHCKDHLNTQYNFFDRALFLVEIFNFFYMHDTLHDKCLYSLGYFAVNLSGVNPKCIDDYAVLE